MKLIKAIIRHERLHDVLHALYEIGVRGITVSRVQGHGGEPEMEESYRGARVRIELHEKIQLDIVVSEPFVEPTIESIMKTARTGQVGDGKVIVQPIERIYRIRTGEIDTEAVTPVHS